MTEPAGNALPALQNGDSARALLRARKEGRALEAFPGVVPTSLDEAYALQDAVLALDGSEIGGWKVGAVGPAWQDEFGSRLVGPIMGSNVWRLRSPDLALREGWFHAVEAEFAVRLSRDIAAGEEAPGVDEIGGLIEEVRLAVEIICSTMADPASFGPAAVIADYGLNGGVVLGPPVADWSSKAAPDLSTAIRIRGAASAGSAGAIAGGLAGAAAFCVSELHRRGRGVSCGLWICTGATSGLHRLDAGGVLNVGFVGREAIVDLRAS